MNHLRGDTTLAELLNAGWQVNKRGMTEYYRDSENAILRSHITLHEFFRSQNEKYRRSKKSLGFINSAQLAFDGQPEGDALLLELRLLNTARNAIAHEWAFVPRLIAVMPFVRALLKDTTIPDELLLPERYVEFVARLQVWEESILKAMGVKVFR